MARPTALGEPPVNRWVHSAKAVLEIEKDLCGDFQLKATGIARAEDGGRQHLRRTAFRKWMIRFRGELARVEAAKPGVSAKRSNTVERLG